MKKSILIIAVAILSFNCFAQKKQTSKPSSTTKSDSVITDAKRMNKVFEDEIDKMSSDLQQVFNELKDKENVDKMNDTINAIRIRTNNSIKKIEDYKAVGKGGEVYKTKTIEYIKTFPKAFDLLLAYKNFTTEQDEESQKWIFEWKEFKSDELNKRREFQKAQEVYSKENGIK